eukprot:TRINITY_DN3884_c0_g1_i1.p1 TRINITY_DN3884_c0_g1~~TRINITY_DN3884_c0_g1_i1.p1  ORF type:complete len:64 (-),score=1.67 TRINITY_DN3884_c0_g1_i1:51-242(-)
MIGFHSSFALPTSFFSSFIFVASVYHSKGVIITFYLFSMNSRWQICDIKFKILHSMYENDTPI